MRPLRAPAVVYVVDDDLPLLRAVTRRLELSGFTVRGFTSAANFLAWPRTDLPSCAILDLHMPGIDGLAVQERLAAGPNAMPVIFLTGRGDIPSSVRAMKNGAVDFLTKPASGDELVDAIERALAHDIETRRTRDEAARTRALYFTLTPRQREVFALLTAGALNKQAAAQLGTSERTVKAHRAQIMAKMRAGSFADLVRAAERLGIERSVAGGEPEGV